MKTNLEIAQEAKLLPITEVAAQLGLTADDLELYGKYKAKVHLDCGECRKPDKKPGKLILVSAITPTPAGEGKTTTSIGLAMGLNRLGAKAALALRQPSLGPTLGMKGGATGGGFAQVLPMEEINLHFTGDFHAIAAANNLLSAMIDNHIYWRKEPLLDPRRVLWRRTLDMDDRSLRHIIVGLGGAGQGVPREGGFDIVAASEVMAIFTLCNSLPDLRERLGRILAGFGYDKKPVLASDIGAAGAMTVLLRDALMPNLVQTIEGTPAFIHGGPFANIAQGTNSVLATKMALNLADYTVTEAGFGFDLGAEKFFDIKCVSAGLEVHAVVLVATIRALKLHGGVPLEELTKSDPAAVERGLPNLVKHLENIKKFHEKTIVALNRFGSDTPEEIKVVQDYVEGAGERFVVNDGFASGGKGAEWLASIVKEVADGPDRPFTPMYNWSWTVERKVETVAREIYGAQAVDWTPQAKDDLERIYNLGYGGLPVCIAKTQKSLSDNPELLGRPKDFLITVREVQIAAGAGFLIPITGKIMRMPGLPRDPAAAHIDIAADGKITGLF